MTTHDEDEDDEYEDEDDEYEDDEYEDDEDYNATDDYGGRAALDVTDPVTRKPRRLTEQCSTCIMRPGDLMHLGPARLRNFINAARRNDSYVVCHQTLPGCAPDGYHPAVCRGFADKFSTNYLRIMERLGGFEDVEPPKKEDQ